MTKTEEMNRDFAEYTDTWGLLQPMANPAPNASGNGIFYTALKVLCYYDMLGKEEGDIARQELEFAVMRCWDKPGPAGCLNRSPIHPDQNSHDDYTGAATALAGTWTANQIAVYGRDHNWIFMNRDAVGFSEWAKRIGESPGNAWRHYWGPRFAWRMPQVRAHIKWSAGMEITPFESWWWSAAMIRAAELPREKNNYYLLAYLMARLGVKQGGEYFGACVPLLYAMEKHFGTLGKCCEEYFINPAHPLARYWTTSPTRILI